MRNPVTPHKPTTGFAQSLFSLRNRHFFALDLLIFCITPIAALALRTDGLNAVTRYADALGLYTLVAIVLRWIVFIPFGLYSRYWRHASTDEIVQIFLAVTTATLMIAVVFFGILRPFGLLADDFPRSIPFLDGILVLPAVGGCALVCGWRDECVSAGGIAWSTAPGSLSWVRAMPGR